MSTQYVGIDLHRRRSVITRTSAEGEVLSVAHIENSPVAFADAIAAAGESPEVALEATYGWYWVADLLEAEGAQVHLAHPLGMKKFTIDRVKNDRKDAFDLADMLRLGRLPEAWIAPPAVREVRELVRYRAKLVALRTSLKNQVHAVLAKEGVRVPFADLFGVAGTRLLDELDLGHAYMLRLDSLRHLISAVERELAPVEDATRRALANHPGYRAIQAIHGVGPVLAAVFTAEVGDVTRFSRPEQLCSWVGLTPRHRESDRTVHRGHITKQGSALVRWAAVEAAQRIAKDSKAAADFARIANRRGRKIGRVAIARRVVTLVFYGLRDHRIRCLEEAAS